MANHDHDGLAGGTGRQEFPGDPPPAGDKTEPAPISVERFIEAVADSGLLTAEEIGQLRGHLSADAPLEDARELARRLIDRGKLTEYQAKVLLERRGDPLMMDRYIILDLIGSGGMGVVFKALHRAMDRIVALKVLPPGAVDSPEKLRRFRREVRAAAALSHPNIVTAHDADQSRGIPFLVMEYVEGRDLHHLVKEHGPLPVAMAVDYASQAAWGLGHAHGKGIVHRDIKPSNLLRATDGTIKVLDLGLARFESPIPPATAGASADPETTQAGSLVGTYAYMAPEQAFDLSRTDQRSDVYSLGCTLHYLLTGHSPYGGENSMRTLLAHREGPIPSLRAVRPDVPEELETVFRRMVAKRPEDRYQSMAEVLAALKACVLQCGSVVAGPPLAHDPVSMPTHVSVGSWSSVDPHAETVDLRPPARWPTGTRRRWWISGAAVLALAALVFTWTFFRGRSPAGTLVLGVEQSDLVGAVVHVDERMATTIRRLSPAVELRVTPGDHTLQVSKAGFTPYLRRFHLDPDEREVLPIHLARATPDAPGSQPSNHSPPVAAGGPGTALEALPGLIPRPASLPGLRRYQVETVAPRGPITSIAWSPQHRLIAVGTGTRTVRVYDPRTFRLVLLLIGHTGRVNAVSWSPDGRWLASASQDGTVRLWSPDGAPGPVLKGHDGPVLAVAWSPDSQRLATGGRDTTVRTWGADGTVGPVLRGHSGEVSCVAWGPTGGRLASGGGDGMVRTWAADGTQGKVLGSHQGPVRSLAWSPDERRLASGGRDRLLRLWKFDGTPVRVLKGHAGSIRSLVWSPNGRRLASGGGDKTIRFWSADGKAGPVRRGLRGPALALAWGPDGKQLASGGQDGSIRLWTAEGKPGPVLEGLGKAPLAVTWRPDGGHVATAGADGLRLWKPDGTPGPVLQGHEVIVWCVAWSPDGSRLASGDEDGVVRLWSADGTPGPVLEGHESGVTTLAWSPDGGRLVSASDDGTLRTWAADGTPGLLLPGHKGSVLGVAWSPDGRRLASAGADGTVRFWAADGTQGPVLTSHTGAVHAVAWSHDGGHLASGGEDRTVRLWTADGKAEQVLRGHQGAVLAVKWSPNGRHLASGGRDRTVRLWKPDGAAGSVLIGHAAEVTSVAFSLEGRRIASGGRDATLRLWDAATAQALWVVVLLGGGRSATLGATGDLLRADDGAEQGLVYLVEKTPGKIELLEPAEFRKLVKRPSAGEE